MGVGGNSPLKVSDSILPRIITITPFQDGALTSSKLTATSVYSNCPPNWNTDTEIVKNGELLHTFQINSALSNFSLNNSFVITGVIYGRGSCFYQDRKQYLNEIIIIRLSILTY